MKKIMIDSVTRIEGHAKVSIHLNEEGKVSGAQFHVTQVRGFEKFTEGRPFYEMPSITARICGICPVSHLLASVKACDAIMAVQIPETAALLRELLHCGQFVQSHALSFFHLSAPDLLLGMDSDPAQAQRARRDREASRARSRWHRAAEIRPAGHRRTGEGAHPSFLDRAGRRQCAAHGRRCATGILARIAQGESDRAAHARILQERGRSVRGRDRATSATRRRCTPAWWTPSGALAAL